MTPHGPRIGALTLLLLIASAITAHGRVLLEPEEALQLAFPEATSFERVDHFLDPADREAAGEIAGSAVERELWTRYTALREADVLGYAYFDTHVVRSLRETLLVALDKVERVRRVEVVAFAEPVDYLPRRRWYEQFDGQELDDDLAIDRDIRLVTGATLSARAATAAARRVLAVHRVLVHKRETEDPEARLEKTREPEVSAP